MFDFEKEYTAEEIDEIIDNGWDTDEEYLEIVRLVENCKISEQEMKKLRISGNIDMLYGAYESYLLD